MLTTFGLALLRDDSNLLFRIHLNLKKAPINITLNYLLWVVWWKRRGRQHSTSDFCSWTPVKFVIREVFDSSYDRK